MEGVRYYLGRLYMFAAIFLNKFITHHEKNENNARVSIKGNLLTVEFQQNGFGYVYYGERNVKHLETVVLTPDEEEINFYPGFIPKIKATNIGYPHLFAEIDNERKKITSTGEIFDN